MSAQDLFFFFNGVNDYDFSLVPDSSAPLRFPNGRYYQKYRYSGHFYVHDLNFRRYPFQTISLPLALELKSIDLLDTGTPLNVVLDHEHSGVGSYIEIAGYIKKGFTFSSYLHKYINAQGEPGLINDIRSLFQARMEIAYGKAPMATVIKLLLPLITVMAIILLSTLIPLKGWEVRLAIPPTVILTLIFLQQAYQANLPDLPYITFLDCLYNMSYLSALMIFGLYLWGSMEYHLQRKRILIKPWSGSKRSTGRFFWRSSFFFPWEPGSTGLPWVSSGIEPSSFFHPDGRRIHVAPAEQITRPRRHPVLWDLHPTGGGLDGQLAHLWPHTSNQDLSGAFDSSVRRAGLAA